MWYKQRLPGVRVEVQVPGDAWGHLTANSVTLGWENPATTILAEHPRQLIRLIGASLQVARESFRHPMRAVAEFQWEIARH